MQTQEYAQMFRQTTVVPPKEKQIPPLRYGMTSSGVWK